MSAFIVWTSFILSLELIFKMIVFRDFFNAGFPYLIVFSILLGCVLTIITRLFRKIFNRVFSYILLIIISFTFGAQYIYFKIYNSPFSFYSLTQGGANQALDASGKILETILQNPLLVLLFVPLIIYIICDILKVINYNRINLSKFLVILSIIILCISSTMLMLSTTKKNDRETYEALIHSYNPILITNYFGINAELFWDLNSVVLKTITPNITIKTEDNNLDKEVLEEQKEEVKYNIIEIDFDTLINNETDEVVKNMHNYFKSVEPTNQNEYTGVFKGKNLILVLAESFTDLAIDPVLTPTLYKMYNEGFSFNNFYTPLYPVSTLDGEYITATGLIPKPGVWSLKYARDKSLPFTLANMLKDQEGYSTKAYHNHTGTYYSRYNSIPNLGYDSFKTCSDGLNINCKIWPESDLEMIEATSNEYINSSTPFLTYYITVSGHLQYNLYNSMAVKNWNNVEELNYSTPAKAYLACQIELDRAMQKLIESLEVAGKAEDTVIALSGDHYPYGLTKDQINELSDSTRDENFDIHKSTFLLWHKGIKHVEVNKLASSMDIVPTLANMFGLKYDSRLLMGRDIFSDTEPLVIFANKSWISEHGRYNALTNSFIIDTNESINENYVESINSIVSNRFYISSLILDKNYYSKLNLK